MRGMPGVAAEGAYFEDVAGAIDRPEEVLAEELGCTPAVARRVLGLRERWVAEGMAEAGVSALIRPGPAPAAGGEDILSVRVRELIGLLLQPKVNFEAWIWGLIFAAGMDFANGVHSQAEVARRLRVTRALMSHYARRWRRMLPWLRDLKHMRKEGTVERCREARMRVVRGNAEGSERA